MVGLSATGQPKWDFVHSTDTFGSGADALHPGALSGAFSVDVSSATDVELIGVLRGDVDGSWEMVV